MRAELSSVNNQVNNKKSPLFINSKKQERISESYL